MAARACDITIQPLGEIAREPLDHIRAALAAAFPAAVSILGECDLPRSAWVPSRGQYDSTRLILALESNPPTEEGRVLAVCDVDLCTRILTFVFGEAEVDGRFAVMSLHRLRQEVYGMPPNTPLFLQRGAKEAIHEIGHTFGLKHCFRYDCIMHASDSIEVTDLKRQEFCARCAAKLSESVTR
jgi:archaemetzincin